VSAPVAASRSGGPGPEAGRGSSRERRARRGPGQDPGPGRGSEDPAEGCGAVEAVVPPKGRYRLFAELRAEGVRNGRACCALGGIAAGVLRLGRAGAVAAGDPPGLAYRPDRHDPPGIAGNLRRSAGARRAGLRARHHRRAQHRQPADAPGRAGWPARALAGQALPGSWSRSPAWSAVTSVVTARTSCGDRHYRAPHPRGKVYFCVVLDAWSRRVVGWAIDSSQRADLTTNALGMAIDSRGPAAGGIIHSDHLPSSRPGHSTNVPARQGCCHRWAASATATSWSPLPGAGQAGGRPAGSGSGAGRSSHAASQPAIPRFCSTPRPSRQPPASPPSTCWRSCSYRAMSPVPARSPLFSVACGAFRGGAA
jgi:hypothetical protein